MLPWVVDKFTLLKPLSDVIKSGRFYKNNGSLILSVVYNNVDSCFRGVFMFTIVYYTATISGGS